MILISYMILARELTLKFGICSHEYILVDDKSNYQTFDYFLYKCLNSTTMILLWGGSHKCSHG
jgi:hypothetical protein